jgi:acetoin utilization protein AcuB
MMNEPISSIMTKNVITLSPTDTLGQARHLLLTNKIHHLPVVQDGRKLVGMITSYDMFKLGKSLEEYQNTLVADVMTRHLATMEPDQHIGAAAEVFMEHLFHAVPIVDENGNLEGIITTTDVIRYEYKKEYPDNLDKFVPENM